MAVASLVLGILAILTCWIPVLGTGLALSSLIVAIIAMCSKKLQGQQTGMKVAGLVLSIISTVIAVLTIVLMIGTFSLIGDVMGAMATISQEIYENEGTEGLVTDLLTVYFENKLSNVTSDMTKEQKKKWMYDRYYKVLEQEYPELKDKGYDIKVKDNLMFEIVSHEQ